MRIKICGITSVADGLAAVCAGADAIGLMFYERSPRHVTRAQAREIARALPPLVSTVGVFVNATLETVRQSVAACGLDTVQLHGDEPPGFCAALAPLKRIRAFRLRTETDLALLGDDPCEAWLLDSAVTGQWGGTGVKADWMLAARARELGRPIILAGGLTPENVADAVRQVHPYGVDVSSGVESAPGRKDADKMRAFVRQVRGWA